MGYLGASWTLMNPSVTGLLVVQQKQALGVEFKVEK